MQTLRIPVRPENDLTFMMGRTAILLDRDTPDCIETALAQLETIECNGFILTVVRYDRELRCIVVGKDVVGVVEQTIPLTT
ncbi:hypothetical protein KC571_03600 [candidate division WWE3 bacterium]|uniref:Uncharacterized protein n=1 Tax=candidate division WWE3 bacterium TaxID=2053526 RepID=A0A955LHG0_UNCKA|nr:hypothetical protein [candidate division WWE3 bacterium]